MQLSKEQININSEKKKVKMNIPFSPPDISEREITEVANALRSGWITTGPRVKKLEKELAEYIGTGFSESGTPRCVCLNSQTACQEMALHVFGVGPGDEVIVPAYTYTASASVVCHVGTKLVVIDSQENSYEMDYDALEQAITENTKAIIPVDIGGVPCDYQRIFEIVERKKHLFVPKTPIQKALGRVAIMADTAHSLGATYKGKMVGNVADFSSFSFHAVKNFTTAEGGCLTWRHIEGWDETCIDPELNHSSVLEINDDDIYKELQLLSLHGQNKDALAKTKLGAWEYDIIGTNYKCNMTDIAAAMGLVQFERYPKMLARREEIIEKYDNAFKKLGIEVLPHYTDKYQSCGHLYLTRIPGINLEQRSEIIMKMAEAGISCNVHYKPLPMHTAYKNLGFDIKDYPNAYKHFENEITLPLHTCLTDEEVDYVIEMYCGIVEGYMS